MVMLPLLRLVCCCTATVLPCVVPLLPLANPRLLGHVAVAERSIARDESEIVTTC